MAVLFSAYAWIFAACFAAVGLPLIAALVAVLPRDRVWPRIGRIARAALAAIGIRARLEGGEHAVPGRRYIVMGNHVSFLDIFLFAATFPMPVIAVEKRENFRLPVYGWLVARWGNIPINREDRDEALRALAEARSRLETWDCALVVMPEGTRTKTGLMGPFKRGGFHLAVQTGTPILPFTFEGAYDVHPTGTYSFRPGEVVVRLHAPIDPAQFGPERLDDFIAAVREAISQGRALERL
ncbi:MAG: 1-acyl-sn-glycerol-3-phosphate acyltransferase [Candidatus Sericytochromatia bacterium]|nr:1-acyl-sn-glycerol-3-phosphate acyltransferase [Candidatus Tanganyikabacteria bacterium]